MVHNGIIDVISQDTVDALIKRGTFEMMLPDRAHMFSPPPEERRCPETVPIVRTGPFGPSPAPRSIGAAVEHLDEAERPVSEFGPTDEVSLTKAVELAGRDGQRVRLDKGTKGEIIRDEDGIGRSFYVFIEDLGCYAILNVDSLKRRG